MKKIIFAIFAVGLIASLMLSSPVLGAASFAGLFFAAHSFKGKYANLMIVPARFVIQKPESNPDVLQEVPYVSRAEKALYDQLVTLGRSNAITRQAIEQGAISYDPISYYMRAVITGLSGKQKIISASTLNVLGITNLPNGAALPQYYNFCFDRIAVRYAVANTAGANVAAITGWSSIRGNMPAALGNGELIISSNRNTIVETPISDFTSVAAITGGGERDYDGGVLEKPRFLLEMLQIEAELNLAQGQSIPPANNTTYAVELMMYGVQARLKY